MKKRRSNKGETLVETLMAVLIVGVASAMFLTFVTTSSNMNRAAKGKDDAVYAQWSAAETMQEEPELGTVRSGTVLFHSDLFGTDSVEVNVYGDSDGLLAYRMASGAAKGGAP